MSGATHRDGRSASAAAPSSAERRLLVERAPAGGPDDSGASEIAGADGVPFGAAWRGNPLRGGWTPPDDAGPFVLAWSGTLADTLFAAHPLTWLRSGHEALAAFCDRVAPGLSERGVRLCLQPHARHVLSDPQSCLTFVRERGAGPFRVALAPASMLEPTMLADLADHLRRAFETLGPVAALVILDDVRPAEDGLSMRRVPLGEGVLPLETVRELLDRTVAEEVPVLVAEDELDRGRRWLCS